ncbi:hypothetical protein CGI30_14235 [Vibrio parahaemolyticus]|uniref:hypothetical protein n=1 Tax=Vibrio parahaemolyticus TaxID=670 RepID=UPI0011204AE7|nr:hypothetical protein [Vibrio parahaemolyticus]TOJ87283.1 hypothetical protein CGI30_14235 [Vibrio parahaemolyticus]
MSEVVEEYIPSQSSSEVALREQQREVALFCEIYERVNSTNDEIKKRYKTNLRVEFDDIKELHEKTVQTINSLNPNSVGLKILLAQNNGESEKFVSFEDFCNYKATSPKPTNNVYMLYNFSLVDSESGEVELYKVKLRIGSRIAMLTEIAAEAPSGLPAPVLASIATPTAMIHIEYSDYIKARSFISMMDEWVQGCDESKESKVFEFLKPYSHLLPALGRNCIFMLFAYATFMGLGSDDLSNVQVAKFFIFYMTVFTLLGSLVSALLSRVEQSIDSYLAISYININKGDRKLIKSFESKNKRSILLSVLGVAATIVIGVTTNTVFEIIKPYIF